MDFIKKSLDYMGKHAELLTVLGLCIVFYFIFFHNIGNYALMDADETRYVAMSREMFRSKDFMTLYLNGNYFFEKPPLYFWGECLSFGMFGKINEFTARFPVAMCGTMISFMVYLVGRKVVSRKYGVISALILATSLEFIILAKFAILDIVLATCIGFALCCGFMVYFCGEHNRKYFWWLFYIFTGLAVLAKGVPGFIIPFGTMFLITLVTKNFKEAIKPKNSVAGLFLFLLITLPWHIIMLKIHNPLFFNEYVMKHHFERFFNSKEIGREQPWWFFLTTLLWGLVPWIFSVIAKGISKLKCINKNMFKNIIFSNMNNEQKLVYFSSIAAIFTLLFLSSSSTKLITYILPIFVPIAFLIGSLWKNYIDCAENNKAINISVYFWGGICVIAAITAVFAGLFLPQEISSVIESMKWFTIILLFVFGVSSITFAKQGERLAVFVCYVIFMVLLSAFGTKGYFNIDYKFGQNELMEYAKFIKNDNKKLFAYSAGRKYSLLYYYGDLVNYIPDEEFESLDKALTSDDNLVVIRNKDIEEIENNAKMEFLFVKQGKKYSVIKGK